MAKKKQQKVKPLPLEWNIPDNIINRFATNMVIQTIDNVFKILFFEIKQPIILSEKDMEKIKKIGNIQADCVGGIIVAPDRLPQFINVLNEHLSKYNKEREKKES